jgi:hypothetical protein
MTRQTALTLRTASLAVALITAENSATGDSTAEILGDEDREPVVGALTIICGIFARALLSGDADDRDELGAAALGRALRTIGLGIAAVDAGVERGSG